MNTFRRSLWTVLALVLGLQSAALALDRAAIEKATGAKGTWNEAEKVFKVAVPRTDIHASVDGIKLTPALGLTSWAAFTDMGDHVMVMGDMTLLENQVTPVMDEALRQGLEVTALHNHFFWDKPKVFYMHIGGMGDEQKLAQAVGAVFASIRSTAKDRAPSLPRIDTSKLSIDASSLEQILGQKAETPKGACKFTFGRKVSMDGKEVGAAMGVNTWAAFAGRDDEALVDGDFAVTDAELQPVLKALRAAKIRIVAIHNHMTREEPRIVFLHYWGTGPARDLAQGLRSALDVLKR